MNPINKKNRKEKKEKIKKEKTNLFNTLLKIWLKKQEAGNLKNRV